MVRLRLSPRTMGRCGNFPLTSRRGPSTSTASAAGKRPPTASFMALRVAPRMPYWSIHSAEADPIA